MTCKHIPVAPAGQVLCLICGKALTSKDLETHESASWEQTMDTLKNILGSEDGSQAIATTEDGVTAVVEQYQNMFSDAIFWIYSENGGPRRINYEWDNWLNCIDPDPDEPIWFKKPEGLERITPQPCQIDGCSNTATWSYNGTAVCAEDMRIMSGMNSDNAEAFAPALNAEIGESHE